MSIIKKFRPFQAPGEFYFKDPDTGHNYIAGSRKQLYQQITNYRRQNGLKELEALDWVIDNYLCSRPENVGKCQDAPLKRGWLQVIKGGVAILENVIVRTLVNPGEAERRAEICVQCAANVFPDKSGFVKWADDLAEASVGDRKVKQQTLLGNCAICTCSLRSKVWYGGDLKLTRHERLEMLRVNPKCWQLEKVK